MPTPPLSPILPGVFRWSAYSPAHRVKLTSHAVWDGIRFLVFDPIPLPLPDTGIPLPHVPDRILLTNENHERDAAAWRERFHVDAWAAPDARLELPGIRRWGASGGHLDGWSRIELPGGPGGETAFHSPALSLMVFGDAIVHLPGRGLEVLPDKYCTDPGLLRASLRNLPAFENAVFAHGDPLAGNASARIAGLP